MSRRPRWLAAVTAALALGAAPAAHAQDTSQTGTGGVAPSLNELQAEFDKQWNGPPGQTLKGLIGITGMLLAFGAARDAVTYEINIDGGGGTSSGSGATGTTGSDTESGTGTTTSSATSTN